MSASICPSNEMIFPCTCQIEVKKAEIRCDGRVGESVTQKSVSEAIRVTRLAQNLASTAILPLFEFDLLYTDLTQLDLTPFINVSMDYLDIQSNSILTSLVGPLLDEGSVGQIRVKRLEISYNPKLTDSGSGFKYLSVPDVQFCILFNV